MTISTKKGPEWLTPFLSGQYFTHCRYHILGKNEKNHFCIDCTQGPLCASGVQIHAGHNTLQVRKASHMDAVRLNDIQKHLDVSNIQVYTINGAKITFLMSRPHSKIAKAGFRCCEICGRNIADPVRFCSIGCKLECAKQNKEDASLSLSLNCEEHGGHNFLETERYKSSDKVLDTPPMLCESEDDMLSYDNPLALSLKKLMVNKWGMELVELPLKRFKSQKSLDGSAEGREKANTHEILVPWVITSEKDSHDGLQTPRKHSIPSNWLQESNRTASATSGSQELASMRVQRKKGIPRRAPLC